MNDYYSILLQCNVYNRAASTLLEKYPKLTTHEIYANDKECSGH